MNQIKTLLIGSLIVLGGGTAYALLHKDADSASSSQSTAASTDATSTTTPATTTTTDTTYESPTSTVS